MAEEDFSINDARTIAGDGGGTIPTEDGTPMDRSIGDGPTLRPKEERGGRGAFAPGDVIAGRYVVEKVLGEGGMGIVYQCLDKVGGVSVAVKCLPPEVSRNADEMEDIRANYRLVSDLHHPNIACARTLEVDVSTGDYYLVMDLARGTSLKRWMRRNPQATMATKLAILRQVAAALDYAHARKVIHRDVKPENVMVDDEGVVKVLDFGLAAQIRSSQSRTSAAVTSRGGTPGYKSPEQWRGKPQREPADVYSFGVMAYWMFAGALPFDGDDPVVLGHAVLTEPVEPITGLPAHMNAALVKALAKEPNGRFASCGAVVDALEGKGFSRVEHVERVDDAGGSRSRATAKIIFAAAALALAVAGGWWYYRQGQAREQARVAAEAERQKTAAEEARRKAEEEARQKAAAEEAKRKVKEEARQKAAAEEAKRKAAEEAKRKAEEEARQKAAAEEAKALFVKTTLQSAQSYFDAEKWQDCIAEADKVLGWDAGNETAAKLKKDAESHLVPTMQVVAKIDDSEVPGAKVEAGGKIFTTPFAWKLIEGSRYGPYNVSYESDGKRYYGTIDSVTADWRGPRVIPVMLKEYTEPRVIPVVLKVYTEPKEGDCKVFTLPGGVRMEMVYVGPGSFQMGSASGEDDKPSHQVRLTKGYWIGKYPVTQVQWDALVSGTGVTFDEGQPTAYFSRGGVASDLVSGMDTSDFPMEGISWNDCKALVDALNGAEREGQRWSLPTEAQWEFAARGGNKSRGYTYSGGKVGWYYENSGMRRLSDSNWKSDDLKSNRCRPHSVKEEDVGNELGIVGMSGNVWEWCNDWYDINYYSNSPAEDPQGPASGVLRVLRGGCWYDIARACRSSNRYWDVPGYRINSYGFRLCCSAETREGGSDGGVPTNQDGRRQARADAHDKVQLWENGPYWATTNIGAEKPEDYGYYFWWGDTVGYKREGDSWVASDGSVMNFSFDEANTPTCKKHLATLQNEGWIMSDNVLAPTHDAAHVHWGGAWRMPTKQELDDLGYKCDWNWTTINGVKGYVIYGRGNYASQSIFLPCVGKDSDSSYGGCWSSVPKAGIGYSWSLSFNSSSHDTYDSDRYRGRSVRPVQGFTQ